MRTPDLMPILYKGAHSGPSKGACLMEMASYLAGEEWSDRPACTHPVLAAVARTLNDLMPDEDRGLLLDLLPRLMGTAETGSISERKRLSGALVAWLSAATNTTKPPGNFQWAGVDAALAADAAGDQGMDLVALLAGLIAEHDRLTGRTTPASLTADDTTRLVQLAHA